MKADISHVQHALAQLQNKRTTIVAGAAADTDIAVADITLDSELVSVIENAGGTLTDRTATTTITSAGNIQCSVITTGDQLIVEWLPAPSSVW